MEIKQFEDKNLSHYSYAIVSDQQMAVIDPSRNSSIYMDFAKEKGAEITTIIETHPHADFVSGHAELARISGADIYVSGLVGAVYDHKPFDEGQSVTLGSIKLIGMNTPGHSPDSITIIMEGEKGEVIALFTGDTLFIGDCGRPDLRENVGNIQEQREKQAGNMYESLQRFLGFQDHVMVYPAHGGGSLCGKGLSSQNVSTIGLERIGNWSLQPMKKEIFIKSLTEGQPYIPKYFGYDVELNRQGAPDYERSIHQWKELKDAGQLDKNIIVIDARSASNFNEGHLEGAINIPDAKAFETWLGSIVSPDEKFYLIGASAEHLQTLVERMAKIGYEQFFEGGIVAGELFQEKNEVLDVAFFRQNPTAFTIVDVRAVDEAREILFPNAINIPLYQLRERVNEIPGEGDIVVHCAGGYRSNVGRSIIKATRKDQKIYDLGEFVRTFEPNKQLLAST